MAQKKQTQSTASDIGSMNNSKINQLGSQGQYNKSGQEVGNPRYNLNNTMPVGGIAQESLNMMR